MTRSQVIAAWDAEIERRGGEVDAGTAETMIRGVPSARPRSEICALHSMTLRLHRLAVIEIDAEVDYFEGRQTGLGAELEDSPVNYRRLTVHSSTVPKPG